MLERTLRALDWDVVCEALALHARTTRGAAACRTAPLYASPDAVRERYAEVSEALDAARLNDEPPVGAVLDVEDPVDRAARGSVLDVVDLRAVGVSARALARLRDWGDDHAEDFPRLATLCGPINVDPELVEVLDYAFDAAGELSESTYPELGTLRRRIAQLRDRIRSTLEDILRGSEWADALQDRFVSEREGRFVVPVKMAARRGLGIVHGISGSGETAFVEPGAVVELHNELKETEGELARTERRILTDLSRDVGRRHAPLRAALAAAITLDLVVARAGLGRSWTGTVPIVGNDGVVALRDARHPVLVLRAKERGGAVVGNDLSLTPQRPGLVVTGPNAGGKTVALKTIGLAALLVRAGVPLPAAEGSRMDVFDPVVADVGDQQSVTGGLSTFSAHVGILKEALAGARLGALVLLDEVAVGTDPAQGAALARSVLETVVDAGARVVATTHYPELKALGGADGRFAVAAAQYEDGKPTYRVEIGAPGASYALAMARALGLPDAVIDRARELMDANARALADELEKLSAERQAVAARARAMEAREAEIAARSRKLADAEERLAREGRRAMEAQLDKHKERLKKSEDDVRAIVAALQSGADLKSAGKALETVKATRAALAPPEVPSTPAPPRIWAVGDRVRVRTLGQLGTVSALGEQLEVDFGRMRVRVSAEQLEDPALPPAPPKPKTPAQPPKEERRAPEPARPEAAYVRTTSNTCDMRGMRGDEALEHADRFLDGVAHGPERVAFLLHGHGTGALKRAVRGWLPTCRYVREWRPANSDEGGDAYTVVEVK